MQNFLMLVGALVVLAIFILGGRTGETRATMKPKREIADIEMA